MRLPRRVPAYCILVAVVLVPVQLMSQAVQGALHAAERLQEREKTHALLTLQQTADVMNKLRCTDANGRAWGGAGEEVRRIGAPSIPQQQIDAASAELRSMQLAAVTGTCRTLERKPADASDVRTLKRARLPTDVPAALGPRVNFTVDGAWDAGAPGRAGNSTALLLETNLVGAAAGAAFGALDDKLGEYLKNNLASASGIPRSGKARLFSTVSVALGQFATTGLKHDFILLPAVSLTEADTSDPRIAKDLVDTRTRESWSILRFHLTLAFDSKCYGAGDCHVPLVYLTGNAPQYYPGTPFEGIAALFGDSRSKFRNAGKWTFGIGVALPLAPIQRPAS